MFTDIFVWNPGKSFCCRNQEALIIIILFIITLMIYIFIYKTLETMILPSHQTSCETRAQKSCLALSTPMHVP